MEKVWEGHGKAEGAAAVKSGEEQNER